MAIIIDDSPELRAEALECELDSALRKLLSVLVLGKDANEAAWWLCANHGMFLINYERAPLMRGDKLRALIRMAETAGTPPSHGEKTWDDWFVRLRRLRDERNSKQ